MAEKDVKELKDEELEKVSGGGSGLLPKEGITFNTYTSPRCIKVQYQICDRDITGRFGIV